ATEGSAAHVADWIREVRVVKEVEEVRPEGQSGPLTPNRETLQRREVVVHQAGAVVLISTRSSNASSGRIGAGADCSCRGLGAAEMANVESEVRVGVVGLQRAASNDIRTVCPLCKPAEIV